MFIPYILCIYRSDGKEDGRKPSGPVIVTLIDNMLPDCILLCAVQQ